MAEVHKVVDGKITVTGFPDGSTVVVTSPEESKPYVLSEDEEQYIQKSIDQFERGEHTNAFQHLDSLRN